MKKLIAASIILGLLLAAFFQPAMTYVKTYEHAGEDCGVFWVAYTEIKMLGFVRRVGEPYRLDIGNRKNQIFGASGQTREIQITDDSLKETRSISVNFGEVSYEVESLPDEDITLNYMVDDKLSFTCNFKMKKYSYFSFRRLGS